MKRNERELKAFKVKQAVGSMAIERIHISPKTRQVMEDVAAGRIFVRNVKNQLIEKYRSGNENNPSLPLLQHPQ